MLVWEIILLYNVFKGNLVVECLPPISISERRFDKNEEENFYYKSSYHFIAPYYVSNCNKKMTLNLFDRLNV